MECTGGGLGGHGYSSVTPIELERMLVIVGLGYLETPSLDATASYLEPSTTILQELDSALFANSSTNDMQELESNT